MAWLGMLWLLQQATTRGAADRKNDEGTQTQSSSLAAGCDLLGMVVSSCPAQLLLRHYEDWLQCLTTAALRHHQIAESDWMAVAAALHPLLTRCCLPLFSCPSGCAHLPPQPPSPLPP